MITAKIGNSGEHRESRTQFFAAEGVDPTEFENQVLDAFQTVGVKGSGVVLFKDAEGTVVFLVNGPQIQWARRADNHRSERRSVEARDVQAVTVEAVVAG